MCAMNPVTLKVFFLLGLLKFSSVFLVGLFQELTYFTSPREPLEPLAGYLEGDTIPKKHPLPMFQRT